MGCCFGSYEQTVPSTPDRATMRELQAQAIEKRLRENESRGIKDVESVRRAQARKEAQDNMANVPASSDGLRWQVNN